MAEEGLTEAALERIERLADFKDEGFDFATAGEETPAWDRIGEGFRAAVESLWRSASVHARVDTGSSTGAFIGSIVPYGGSIVTVCSPRADAEFAAEHCRRLDAAIGRRLLVLRATLTAARVMATLAAAQTSPVLALVSARNAWKLVEEVRELVRVSA